MNAEIGKAFIIQPDRAHPMLPLGEFTTQSGFHPLGGDDAAGEQWQNLYMATYKFPNGHVATVISGRPFYCRDDAPYELMWQSKTEDDANDVYGYLNDEELMLQLIRISQQPDMKGNKP